MNIDMGFWLSLALLVCVLTWIIDRIFKIRKPKKTASQSEQEQQGEQAQTPVPSKQAQPSRLESSVEFIISLIPVFLVVLVIRSFIAEPFNIPSGSMIPTLKINDFIVVDKFAYGLKLPVIDYKFLPTGEPKRGDVMVFRYPHDTSVHFIKRVIGLPGDTVAMREGHLYLNGKEVPQTELRNWVEGGVFHELLVENLDGHKHLVQRLAPINPYTGQPEWSYRDGEWTVPPGHYFMMGDNRDNSNDSRFWGTVPEKLVEGRAFLIWMHLDSEFPWVDFSRDGHLDKKANFQ